MALWRLKTAAPFAYAPSTPAAYPGGKTAMKQKNDMSTVPVFILCGGLGTRIKEET